MSHGRDDMDPSAEKALDAAFWGTSQGERSAGRGHRPPLLLVEALWQRAEATEGDQRNPRAWGCCRVGGWMQFGAGLDASVTHAEKTLAICPRLMLKLVKTRLNKVSRKGMSTLAELGSSRMKKPCHWELQ